MRERGGGGSLKKLQKPDSDEDEDDCSDGSDANL